MGAMLLGLRENLKLTSKSVSVVADRMIEITDISKQLILDKVMKAIGEADTIKTMC